MEDRAQQGCHAFSPRVTVGHPAYSIANQASLPATAADAIQQLIIPKELRPGNRLRRAPGVVDFEPSCEQQALRQLARGFRQREIARLLVKEE